MNSASELFFILALVAFSVSLGNMNDLKKLRKELSKNGDLNVEKEKIKVSKIIIILIVIAGVIALAHFIPKIICK